MPRCYQKILSWSLSDSFEQTQAGFWEKIAMPALVPELIPLCWKQSFVLGKGRKLTNQEAWSEE
jgi:hypothetical protein